MKLSSAITAFIAEIRVHKAKQTAIGYESDLRRLAAKAQVDSVLRFTPDLVKHELAIASASGRAMSTLHRKRSCFNSFGRWGVKNRLWVENSVDLVQTIRRPKHVPRPYAREEVARLLALPVSEREALLMQVLFLTGLRATPIGHLKVGNVTFSPPQIRAWVKGAKTQILPIHPALVGPLRDYIAKRTDGKPQTHLFPNRNGGPMHRRTLERLTGIWGRKAKVPTCIPHRFRHTFGTEMLRRTKDLAAVQEAMAHADMNTTRGYAALADDQLAQAVAQIPWVGQRVIATTGGERYASSETDPQDPHASP